VAEAADEKSTPELLRDLTTQVTTLVHEEVELAKAEMSVKGRRIGEGLGLISAVAVLCILLLGCLVAAAIAALSIVLTVWQSALVVAGGLAVCAGIAGPMAILEFRRSSPPVPEEAVTTSKENIEWLKTQARSAKR
jgi:hypothetical protein